MQFLSTLSPVLRNVVEVLNHLIKYSNKRKSTISLILVFLFKLIIF